MLAILPDIRYLRLPFLVLPNRTFGLELVCQSRDIKRAGTIAKRYRLLCTPLLIPTLGSRIHGREDGPFGLCADLRRCRFLMQNHDTDAVGLSAILTHEVVIRCLIGQRYNTDHMSQFFRPRVNDAPTACRAKQFRHAPPSVIVSFFQQYPPASMHILNHFHYNALYRQPTRIDILIFRILGMEPYPPVRFSEKCLEGISFFRERNHALTVHCFNRLSNK